jgi:hypothetical protein
MPTLSPVQSMPDTSRRNGAEVQQAICQLVTATELYLGSMLKALIITACQPNTALKCSPSTETLHRTAPPA